jgi:hypothetical protein
VYDKDAFYGEDGGEGYGERKITVVVLLSLWVVCQARVSMTPWHELLELEGGKPEVEHSTSRLVFLQPEPYLLGPCISSR